jgi:hypothetical protein
MFHHQDCREPHSSVQRSQLHTALDLSDHENDDTASRKVVPRVGSQTRNWTLPSIVSTPRSSSSSRRPNVSKMMQHVWNGTVAFVALVAARGPPISDYCCCCSWNKVLLFSSRALQLDGCLSVPFGHRQHDQDQDQLRLLYYRTVCMMRKKE